MSAAGQRDKAYRQRLAAGRMIFHVEGDVYVVPDTLIELGLLTETAAADKRAVNVALGRFVEAALRSAKLKFSATRRAGTPSVPAMGGREPMESARVKRSAAGG